MPVGWCSSEELSLHSIPPTPQATETGSAELAKSMYFPLADKLISKYFKEHKVDAEAGTSVCVGVCVCWGGGRIDVLSGIEYHLK